MQVNLMDFQDFAVDLPHIFWRLDSLVFFLHWYTELGNLYYESRVKLTQPPFLDNRLIHRFKYTVRLSSDNKLNRF